MKNTIVYKLETTYPKGNTLRLKIASFLILLAEKIGKVEIEVDIKQEKTPMT